MPAPDLHDGSDACSDRVPDVLTWLQGWYVARCDGEWEHARGVEIGTLDNPGWRVQVDLAGTPWSALGLEGHEIHRSEHDWVVVLPTTGRFEAACGPLNLGEALHHFRLLVDGQVPHPAPAPGAEGSGRPERPRGRWLRRSR